MKARKANRVVPQGDKAKANGSVLLVFTWHRKGVWVNGKRTRNDTP